MDEGRGALGWSPGGLWWRGHAWLFARGGQWGAVGEGPGRGMRWPEEPPLGGVGAAALLLARRPSGGEGVAGPVSVPQAHSVSRFGMAWSPLPGHAPLEWHLRLSPCLPTSPQLFKGIKTACFPSKRSDTSCAKHTPSPCSLLRFPSCRRMAWPRTVRSPRSSLREHSRKPMKNTAPRPKGKRARNTTRHTCTHIHNCTRAVGDEAPTGRTSPAQHGTATLSLPKHPSKLARSHVRRAGKGVPAGPGAAAALPCEEVTGGEKQAHSGQRE